MYRTTILLPDSLKLQLDKEADKTRISFGELVRKALQNYLLLKSGKTEDPFLASQTVFTDKKATDVSGNHDAYLYSQSPHGTKTSL